MSFDYQSVDEVDRPAPGVFRVDVEALFGHIDDPGMRLKLAKKFGEELKSAAPDGSIIIPIEVEYAEFADEFDEQIREIVREEIDT